MKSTTAAVLVPIFLFLLLPLFLSAQPVTGLRLVSQTTAPMQEVVVPIRVSQFVDIVGLQFSMQWDPAQLRLLAVEDLALGTTLNRNFNLTQSAAGRCSFQWMDEALQGVALPNNGMLFGLRFLAIGQAGAVATIAFTDSPTLREVADRSWEAIAADFGSATVTLSAATATTTNRRAATDWHAFPNPFVASTILRWQQPNSGMVQLSVVDSAGKTVLSRQWKCGAGLAEAVIQAQELPAAGVYTATLTTDKQTFTKQLIVTK